MMLSICTLDGMDGSNIVMVCLALRTVNRTPPVPCWSLKLTGTNIERLYIAISLNNIYHFDYSNTIFIGALFIFRISPSIRRRPRSSASSRRYGAPDSGPKRSLPWYLSADLTFFSSGKQYEIVRRIPGSGVGDGEALRVPRFVTRTASLPFGSIYILILEPSNYRGNCIVTQLYVVTSNLY